MADIVLERKRMLCTSCMTEHDVDIVDAEEDIIFKNEQIHYKAKYYYCNVADEYYADERMLSANYKSMNDAYSMAISTLV